MADASAFGVGSVFVVNMLEAKSTLSRLVKAVESGAQNEIIIARSGRPVAKLVSVNTRPVGQRIGVAKGSFVAPDDTGALDHEAAQLFVSATE